MAEENRVQILMELGLTSLQAKTYLALSQIGNATIKTIAKNSKIARQDVYRIMPSLEKIGLAEQIIASPTMYKPTPMKEGYKLLLQKKKIEQIRLEKKTTAFIKRLQENRNKPMLQDDEPYFNIIYSKNILAKRLFEKEQAVQTSIDVAGTWETVRRTLFYRSEHYRKLLDRNVRIRIITEKSNDDFPIKHNQELFINPLFEIRYLPLSTPIETTIYDKNEVNLCLTTPSTGIELPILWSNNHQFVNVISSYFDELWNKATS